MKRLFAIVLFCVLVPCVYGETLQIEGGRYTGEVVGGRAHGQGTWTHPDGHKYVGEYKGGKKHGLGTFILGKTKGLATYAWFGISSFGDWEGAKYVGEWREDMMHGRGTYVHSQGVSDVIKYVGEFKDNKPWNGIKFLHRKREGTFSGGRQCRKCSPNQGQVALVAEITAAYRALIAGSDSVWCATADWALKISKSSCRSHDGKEYASKDKARAAYKSIKERPRGSSTAKFWCATASWFRLMTGSACLTNGGTVFSSKYLATAEHKRLNGGSTSTPTPAPKATEDKKTIHFPAFAYVGVTINGIPEGFGTAIYKGKRTGEKYVGEWRHGLNHGKGTYTFLDGKYVGEFKNGERDGYGVLTAEKNCLKVRYEGGWKKGKKHGQGTVTFPDGSKLVSKFWEDQQVDADVWVSRSQKYAPNASTDTDTIFENAINAYKARNYQKALALWQSLAKKGHAPSQANVGVIAENGYGVPVNLDAAASWYLAAAKQNNVFAMVKLANLQYRLGHKEAAKSWAKLAARNNSEPARKLLSKWGVQAPDTGLHEVAKEQQINNEEMMMFLMLQQMQQTQQAQQMQMQQLMMQSIMDSSVPLVMPNIVTPSRSNSQKKPSTPTNIYQPTQTVAPTSRGCSSDFSCGVGFKCVKAPLALNGTCLKEVNQFGIGIHRTPDPYSVRPNTNISGQCMFDTDCPVSFKCDRRLKVCVK